MAAHDGRHDQGERHAQWTWVSPAAGGQCGEPGSPQEELPTPHSALPSVVHVEHMTSYMELCHRGPG
ncbi:hypothetical protein Hesp01_19720 [Herbidospora sp. NBRC 101105]|nr:hypothetical protein Hesp01_19720 [Herbidospora sp. NBRC 101105]